MMFPLTNEDKGHLKRLNENKPAIVALKKLFINEATKTPPVYETQVLAAQKIAELMIEDIFHQLGAIQPDNKAGRNEENVV